MRQVSRLIFLALALVSVSGCALIGGPIADKVSNVVVKYCTEPRAARVLYRQTINAQLAQRGHTLHVHCAGDPDGPTDE